MSFPPQLVQFQPIIPAAADYDTDTAADCVITYAGDTDLAHVCAGVYFSYSGGTFSSGRLTITDGATIRFDVTVPAAGFYPMGLPLPIQATQGNAMTITLYSGGTGVVGKLNVRHFTIELPATTTTTTTTSTTTTTP